MKIWEIGKYSDIVLDIECGIIQMRIWMEIEKFEEKCENVDFLALVWMIDQTIG